MKALLTRIVAKRVSLALGGVLVLMVGVAIPSLAVPTGPVPHLDQGAMTAAKATLSDGGFIPPVFGTAHYAKAVAATVHADKSLPSRYDTRTLGLVTPIKNQGNCGACYAFSTAGDLESKILKEGLGEYDLSENNLKDCHYQGSGCSGGNQYRIVNYLTTNGAVLESCDPYAPVDAACTPGCPRQFTVLEYSSISGSTVAPTATIKQYLMEYGPLHTTLFAGDDSHTAWRDQVTGYDGTGALYYTGSEAPNHSVLIVGWDDTVTHPGGSGAWIIKNSWGTGWGGTCGFGTEAGYFYIAYGSANVGMYSSFVKAFMVQDDRVGLLYHDEGGFTSTFGGLGTVMWGMGVFTATEATNLHRVEFWTSDATVDVDVYIYASFNSGTLLNLLASSLNHSYNEPGYHYVQLDSPLALTSHENLYVAVRFENQSYTYPLTADGDGPTDVGASWYSFNGTNWASLEPQGLDVTIRLRTSTNTVLSVEDPTSSGDEGSSDGNLPSNLKVQGAYPNPFNPKTTISFSQPRSGPVKVGIFDLMGREIRTLVDEVMPAGSQSVIWNGQDGAGRSVPSGIYFCRVEAGYQVRSVKLALLK